MNVAFVMIVFNSDHVLEPCLRSLIPFGKVYAAEGPVKFWQERGFVTSIDRTNEILDQYRITTLHGVWDEKEEENAAAVGLLPKDTDFMFLVDSDEIWPPDALANVFRLLQTGEVDSIAFKPYSFYGGFDDYMTGFERDFPWQRVQRMGRFIAHRPPTMLAPDGKPWCKHRHLNQRFTDRLGINFYHYSYVFPSQMRMKAEYYASMGGNIPDYFNQVYAPWVRGNQKQRIAIERNFNGVHNWIPERRTPCFTKKFTGKHPPEIERVLPQLRERLAEEIKTL